MGAETVIRVTVMPGDLNPYGGAFGGWIIGQMALGAASLVSRHTRGRAILVAASDFAFPLGLVAGDELSVKAEIQREGRTSLHVAAEAFRRERYSETVQSAATGRFTFVAVDEQNRPRPWREAKLEEN